MTELGDTITRTRTFAQVPAELIDDKRVSALGVRLWARLDRYAGANGRAFPSRARLAEDMAVNVRTISRTLTELVDAGWIVRTERAGGVWDTHLNERTRDTSVPTRDKGVPAPGTPVSRPRDMGVSHKEKQEGEEENKSTSRRGSRLATDWVPSPELIEWTRREHPQIGRDEAERFRDYWIGVAGSRGVKADWDATWRNWCRNTSERSGPKTSTTDQRVQQAQALMADAVALDARDALTSGSASMFAIGSGA